MNIDCARFQDMVDELALDLLTGADRADALGHLDECHACRSDVASLTDAADELLFLAPASAPDPGFEDRVLERLGTPARRPTTMRAHRARRRRWIASGLVAAAAAIVLVVAALALHSDHPSQSSVAGKMVTSQGAVVGQVAVRGDHPAVVSMRLPGWDALVRAYGNPRPGDYALTVALHDGSHHLVALGAQHDGQWRVQLTGRARDVDSVSIVDRSGRAWCSAQLV
jgi:hypothetical protein